MFSFSLHFNTKISSNYLLNESHCQVNDVFSEFIFCESVDNAYTSQSSFQDADYLPLKPFKVNEQLLLIPFIKQKLDACSTVIKKWNMRL